MFPALSRSLTVVSKDLPLVLLVALGSISYTEGTIWTWISLIAMVVSLVAGVVLYGRIVSRVRSEPIPSSRKILRAHWFNYLLVLVLIGLPTWGLLRLSWYAGPALGHVVAVVAGTTLLIWAVTVYVLPIVFLKRVGIVAIPVAVMYLFRNIRASTVPLVLVIAAAIVSAGRSIVLVYSGLDKMALGVTMLLIGGVLTYLLFVVFAAAVDVVAQHPENWSETPNYALERPDEN